MLAAMFVLLALSAVLKLFRAFARRDRGHVESAAGFSNGWRGRSRPFDKDVDSSATGLLR
jgi:hypothetical protein